MTEDVALITKDELEGNWVGDRGVDGMVVILVIVVALNMETEEEGVDELDSESDTVVVMVVTFKTGIVVDKFGATDEVVLAKTENIVEVLGAPENEVVVLL